MMKHNPGTRLKEYKLISFDMFQTLVDVNTQKERVMKAVLGDDYSVEKGDSLWRDANHFVFSYFHGLHNHPEGFVEILRIFERCYAELFPKYNVKLNPGTAARVLAKAHGKSLFYDDSLPFLEKVQQHHQTCLISDTDLIMIEEILCKVHFDKVYISEKYGTYKFDPLGTLFKVALDEFKIKPHEMLHIGDGYSDIVGAKRAGADAAWINRREAAWNYEVKPDCIVTSLLELLEA
jgi:putative hydrolase of the HAD superfamily